MTRKLVRVSLWAALALALSATSSAAAQPPTVALEISRLFIEYNESGNDLGFHVLLDGEDWTSLQITSPDGRKIFTVKGSGGYGELGMTELFFEGAEPTLTDVPVDELLALFPEGTYDFRGRTVDKETIGGTAVLSHAIPAGPVVSTELDGDSLVVSWDLVTQSADILPPRAVTIAGYQVIVEEFQVTVDADVTSVTVPPEFVEGLEAGVHDFEVLAIEANGNQTITEGTFTVVP